MPDYPDTQQFPHPQEILTALTVETWELAVREGFVPFFALFWWFFA
jgi:hypothetical protein